MTRLKFDVTGVDPGGDFKVPKPGSYSCKIDVIEPKESQAGNDMLEVQYVITQDGEFEGSRLWDYIVLNDSSAWKYRRFLEAVGAVNGKTEKGEIDLDRLIGKRVLVKVTNEDSDEWGKRARVGSVARLSKADLAEEEEGEEEELEEGEEEELTADDIMHMKKTELKEVVDENELGLRVTKQTKLQALRKRVVEKMIEEEMISDPDEEEEEEELEDEEEVEAEVEDEEEEEEEEEDDEVEEVEDYAELSVGDLRAECKERGLGIKGSKSALVKRLEKDDDETDAL